MLAAGDAAPGTRAAEVPDGRALPAGGVVSYVFLRLALDELPVARRLLERGEAGRRHALPPPGLHRHPPRGGHARHAAEEAPEQERPNPLALSLAVHGAIVDSAW